MVCIPLEALKILISDAAIRTSDTFNEEEEEEEEKVIMVNDVARAYFEAKVVRTIAIELPDEDKADRTWLVFWRSHFMGHVTQH